MRGKEFKKRIVRGIFICPFSLGSSWSFSSFGSTCASSARSRSPLGSSPSSQPLVPLVVSRGFIRWRKECASFGLVISSEGPAEGEDRLRNRNPSSNFLNS